MSIYSQFKRQVQEETFKKKLRLGFHFLYVFLFVFVYVPSFDIPWPLPFPEIITRDVFEYTLISIYIYSIYFFIRKYDVKSKINLLFFIILGMLISLMGLAYFKNIYRAGIWEELLKPGYFERINFSWSFVIEDFFLYIGFAALLSLMLLFINHLNYFFSDNYEEMKNALGEARNQLLRQQLSPHFLFNALNSTYSMALNNHPETANTILKLSGMMRYLTDEVQAREIPLTRELKFLQEYIAVEKIRFGENSDIFMKIDGNPEGKFIEPLLLISLVENAFKHGFYTNHQDAFVHILVVVNDEDLSFSVKNKMMKQWDKKTNREGKGLVNLKKRLALAYSDKAKLILSKDDQIYSALMKITF